MSSSIAEDIVHVHPLDNDFVSNSPLKEINIKTDWRLIWWRDLKDFDKVFSPLFFYHFFSGSSIPSFLKYFILSFQEFFLKHAFSRYSTAKVDSIYLQPSDGSPSASSCTHEQSNQTEWTTTWMDRDDPERKKFRAKSQVALPISEGYLFNKNLLITFIILLFSLFLNTYLSLHFLFRFRDLEWNCVLKSGRITIVKSPKSQIFSKTAGSIVCPITSV